MQYLLDVHTHTIASGHAYNTMNEMIRSAADNGLKLLGISEHAPAMPGSCQETYFYNIHVIPAEKYGVRVLIGAEVNIMDLQGSIDLREYPLNHLDYGIASMHTLCLKSGTREQNTYAYCKVMENPYIQIIGHPDDGRYPVDYKTLVQEARQHHVLLELNNSSLRPDSFRPGTRENDRKMLEYCMEYETPILLGSDAHVEEDVGNFCYADQLLKEVHFPEHLIANTSIELLLSYLPCARHNKSR